MKQDSSWPRPMPKPVRRAIDGRVAYRDIAGDLELELVRRYQRGDSAAGAALCEAHEGLIASYVLSNRGRGLDEADLMQEGRIAFLHAVKRFDPTRRVQLGSYAWHWIAQAARRATNGGGKLLYVPIRVADAARKAVSEGVRLDEKLEDALAADRVSSLDLPAGEFSNATVVDFLSSDEPGPDARFDAAERAEQVRALLDRLTARERLVVLARAGVGDDGEVSLAAVGAHLGLSRETVRTTELRALEKLRRACELIGW